jgi:hypothetical protein
VIKKDGKKCREVSDLMLYIKRSQNGILGLDEQSLPTLGEGLRPTQDNTRGEEERSLLQLV